jgi:phosphoribosylaminoimidazolecarboxamide formyltransferase / IMP cyclohydrolase
MKRAIISVTNKLQLPDISKFLLKEGFEIYSTEGNYSMIINTALENGISVDRLKILDDLTKFPEMLSGRVKPSYPYLYSGLLVEKNDKLNKIDMCLNNFDLLIYNLYPFNKNPSIETIDIGGITLLREAAKNYKNVIVLSSPTQYRTFMDNYKKYSSPDYMYGTRDYDRKQLARCVFSLISNYDNEISKYMSDKCDIKINKLIRFCLKYNMNIHESAIISVEDIDNSMFKLINGSLGMINVFDIIQGWLTVKEVDNILDIPTAISIKQSSLSGLGVGNEINDMCLNYYNLTSMDIGSITPVSIAYMKSRMGDPLSSIGDFICISREVDLATAKLIKTAMIDGIAAPSFTPDAYDILKTKNNGKFKIVKMNSDYYDIMINKGWVEEKKIFGITISQNNNNYINRFDNIVDETTRIDCVLAHTSLKYMKSNNISMAVNGQIIGICSGQQNSVHCIELAGNKAINWSIRNSKIGLKLWNSYIGMKRHEKINRLYLELNRKKSDLCEYSVVMASNGFVPVIDNIEEASKYGVKHIIHLGGSIRDNEICRKCDKLGINVITAKKSYVL